MAGSTLPLPPLPGLVITQPFKTSSTKKKIAFVIDDACGRERRKDGEEGRL